MLLVFFSIQICFILAVREIHRKRSMNTAIPVLTIATVLQHTRCHQVQITTCRGWLKRSTGCPNNNICTWYDQMYRVVRSAELQEEFVRSPYMTSFVDVIIHISMLCRSVVVSNLSIPIIKMNKYRIHNTGYTFR